MALRASRFLGWLGVVALAGAGCSAEPDAAFDEADGDREQAVGDLGDDPGLCERLIAKRAQLGAKAEVGGKLYDVIQGTAKDDQLTGTSGPDLIFGGEGDDKIHAEGGDDIVCAGAGKDFVDGGLGQDRIYGGAGDDILHGGNAGDWIHGDDGDDEVYGDLLDDKLYGDEGADYLVGSHGVDHMHGGPGADWLRGDTNGDDFIGGEGEDTVSFMTARPTGKAGQNAKTVIDADLGKGVAQGDGADEILQGIERVIGSPFADAFTGLGAGEVAPSYGADTCGAQACGNGAPPALPFVFVDARPRDTGVVVLGSAGSDSLRFQRIDGKVVVTETAGAAIHAGPHCAQTTASKVTCTPGAPLHYLMAWGGGGDDDLTLLAGFPRDFNAHLDGGPGDDDLVGADGEDVLFSGRSGADSLDGGPGDDALISESYAAEREKSGKDYAGGADVLLGRGGNDQLVTDYPCGGHYYSGGPGVDIAGFARVGDRPIHAQLRGPIRQADKADFFGKSFLPGVCDVDLFGTTLEEDLEILEGSKGNDKLFGNNRDNILWGRQGNDVLKGFDGDDQLHGHEGNDQVFGGAGNDVERD